MTRRPDEDVPGVERTTTVDQLGGLDIGRLVTLVYDEDSTKGAVRAKRRRYFLKQVVKQPRFKGMMPQPPLYILHLQWATNNVMNSDKWDPIGPMDGSRLIRVGPVFKPGPLRHPFGVPLPPPPSKYIPKAPPMKRDRPANLAYRTESK